MSCEIAQLESLLKELFIRLPEVLITWCDNLSASQLANNLVFHARIKYIEVDSYFIRERFLIEKLR